MCMPLACMWKSELTFRIWCSPTTWAPGIELKSSDLVADNLYLLSHLSISKPLNF